MLSFPVQHLLQILPVNLSVSLTRKTCLVSQVIDLISLKPFDMETISNSIKKTRNAIIVEECMKTGGIGASLSAIINESLFDELDHQVVPHSFEVKAWLRHLQMVNSFSGSLVTF